MANTEHTDTREESLVRGHSGQTFIAITLGTLIANLGRQAFPPLLPAIIDELTITPAAAGFALTLMRICFAISQYPSGRIADTASRNITVVGGMIVMIIGFTTLTQTTSYPLLLLSTGLLGTGYGIFLVSQRVLLSDLFVSKRGRAFGVNSAISRIGSILAAGLAVVTLSAWSWRFAFLPVVILLLAITIAIHILYSGEYGIRELFSIDPVGGHARATLSRVFGESQVRRLVIAYTLVIFAWDGLLSFLPIYLQVNKSFSATFASGGFAMLFAVGIVVQPLAGSLSDRWDRRLVAGIATLTSMCGLGVLLISDIFLLIVTGIVLYAAGLMSFTPVVQAYLMDIFPDDSKGGDLGAFKTVYEGLSSLGPTYVGVVAGVAGYTIAFSGLLVSLAVSATILFWLHYSNSVSG